MQNKKKSDGIKNQLHARNLHRGAYDLDLLCETNSLLKDFVKINKYGNKTIDFFDPLAVKTLNQSLLKTYYHLKYWDIPKPYLCPPIPGRSDYIHYLADVLMQSNNKNSKIPKGLTIRCLDVGVGANCIYPIIGNQCYGWSFVGSDIDAEALANAQKIIDKNEELLQGIMLRKQSNPNHFFEGIIEENERFDLVVCNPPFHASAKEAQAAATRKVNNLKKKKIKNVRLNFGGHAHELWCEGGEFRFVKNMIKESKQWATSCFWFSSLISKESNLKKLKGVLTEVNPTSYQIIPMGQGNKKSRLLVWTFLNPKQQQLWAKSRWI